MTSCRACQKDLLDEVLGIRPPGRQPERDEHLRTCRSCGEYLQELQDTDRALAILARRLERAELSGKDWVMQRVAAEAPRSTGRPGSFSRIRLGRGLIAAAVFALVLLGTFSIPRIGSRAGHPPDPWWLGSSAVWGQGITARLGGIHAITYREQPIVVFKHGSTHVSGSWRRHFESADRKRVDQYYHDTLVSTCWEAPDGPDLSRTDVSHEFRCYQVERLAGGARAHDPVARLREAVAGLSDADRLLGTDTLEGRECVGFQISAGAYGANPEGWTDRVWFDTVTRLPVKIEYHGRPVTGHPEQSISSVLDQFEYHVNVPAALFEPVIPAGYVNAPESRLRQERELAERGPMACAEVPAGLKQELLAALDRIQQVSYRSGSAVMYVSRHAWRMDTLDAGRVSRRQWWVIQKHDMEDTSLDVTDRAFQLTHTIVDYANRRYRIQQQGPGAWLPHPMDRIRGPIGYVDRADRFVPDQKLDGLPCLYLELSARKYGTNPEGMMHCMWFNAGSGLPVRLEFRRIGQDGEVVLTSEEGFEWNPPLPADAFVPAIPEGFTRIEEP